MTLLNRIEGITAGYADSHQVAVAGFIARRPRPEVFELFDSNPGLGLLLAYCEQFHCCILDPWDEAHRMVMAPRATILEWLGMPATKAAVRVMRKLDVRRISLHRCRSLNGLLRDRETAKPLQHLSTVCDEILDVLSDARIRKMVSMHFLEELGRGDVESGGIADDLRRIAELAPLHRARVHIFHSCEAVYEELSRLQKRETMFLPGWIPAYERIVFPDPPIPVPRHTLPDGLLIEPVSTPLALYREAIEQKNCIFSFRKAIAAGEHAVYRIRTPERATVLLARQSQDTWLICDCRAARNRPVQKETVWRVGAYLTRRLEHNLASEVRAEPA